MKMKYPVVTLCGSTKFKEKFEEVQKELTLRGMIVISVGLFGHSGDYEALENDIKLMLDDMHKAKIDMADSIFVVNPGGYIGKSTWSEICYAKMTDKEIRFLEPVEEWEIEKEVKRRISLAERLASRQLDIASHHMYYDDKNVYFSYKKHDVFDPWIKEDVQDAPWAWEAHGDPEMGVNPFEYYGKQKTARFIEEIIMRYGDAYPDLIE